MEESFVLGVSTCIFPGESISVQDYALLERFGVLSVEIGYGHTGAALSQPSIREELVALCQDSRPSVF